MDVGAELTTVNSVRVYDDVQPGEGLRVLVDRLWPRGIRKEDPRVGRWLKDVAPSPGPVRARALRRAIVRC